MADTKMIIVKSRGIVHSSRGIIRTPIITPYRESIDKIWGMLTQDRADVWEVLRNKSEVQLNIQNFDEDNSPKPEKPVMQQTPFTGTQNNSTTNNQQSNKEPEKKDESRRSDERTQSQNTWKNQNQNNSGKNKNNKNKQQNQQNNNQHQNQKPGEIDKKAESAALEVEAEQP